jgi:general secretion pathway protein G
MANAVVLGAVFLLTCNWWNPGCTNEKAARAQLTLLEGAVNTYILDVGSPPSSLDGLVTVPGDLANPTQWAGPYLDKRQLPVDPWNTYFRYQKLTKTRFRLWSSGPDGVSGSADDIVAKPN